MPLHALLMLLAVAPPPIVKERTVRAPPAEVFRAFATREGLRTFFAPEAEVSLRPGGGYVLVFAREAPEGSRGSEGCTVVSFEKDKALRFTWNFPPALPSLREVGARTQVQLTFTAAPGGATVVKLVQEGFRDGPDWSKGRAYFERAWDTVLARLDRRFRRGPFDWSYGYWAPVTTGSLRFLEGAWRAENEGVFHEEVWLNGPAGLGGMSRDARDGAVEHSALLEVRTEGDELFLTVRRFGRELLDAPRSGGVPKRFVLEGLGEKEVVFVEEGAKAPQVLRYARDGEALIAITERPDGDRQRLLMRRLPLP